MKLDNLYQIAFYRQRVTEMNAKDNSDASKLDVTDTEILAFYNKATSTLLTALEVNIKVLQIQLYFFYYRTKPDSKLDHFILKVDVNPF